MANNRQINGIVFHSEPRKDSVGRWTTANGRVVLTRRRTKRDKWRLHVNGKHVGIDQESFVDAVQHNDWAIRKVL